MKLNIVSANEWVKKGAQPTDTVKTLLTNAGVMKKFYETKNTKGE